ncbi:MAG: Maf family protein [Chloroflexaceae bacterium]|jgi:septum formation protein|nr:Maf family protein [Chloroflexaceae bacterium]
MKLTNHLSPAHPTATTAPSLVLASGSPRRRELLAFLGAAFTIAATDAEEQDDAVSPQVLEHLPQLNLPTFDHPTLRAWRKASAIHPGSPHSVVLGADTIVVLDNEVLNKPTDAEHARHMLARLSGRTHTVYTGLCVLANHAPDMGGDAPSFQFQNQRTWFELVASAVTIAPLTAAEIDAYVATGEPLDKAGSYGIQGLGGRLVRAVQGSYTAVVGLPLPATWRLLGAAGITSLTDPVVAYRNWLTSQGKEPLPCHSTLP